MAEINNEFNYSAVTPDIRELAEKAYQSTLIDSELYKKWDVKRGLRDLNGKGVLAGLTHISDVHAVDIIDGKSVPVDGSLFYRGYNVKDLVRGISARNDFGFEEITYLLLFMPCVVLGYRFIPAKARMPFLFAASLLFYGWGNPQWLLLLAWCMLVSWGGVLLINRGGKKRKWLLALVIVLDLLPLFWFKYAGFFNGAFQDLTGIRTGFRSPLLPAGISFFTFQALSYVLDVWRGDAKAQRNPVTFGVYLALFPQLVAGPIVRYTDLEAQLIAHQKPTWTQIRKGLCRFTVGLAKKVLLADALGRFWGQMNADLTQAGALGSWLGLIAFSFQIYFDFAGYSDMAIGLGEALGFVFPENFDYPYRSTSLTEFWRRWHISLTTWFTQYVYIPLGGNRCKTWRRDLNVMIVWALTGLWHGAGWHFVLWGIYFGVLLKNV